MSKIPGIVAEHTAISVLGRGRNRSILGARWTNLAALVRDPMSKIKFESDK